tara:strand:+ start:215 stop:421 length:207 start_codon:yes stop_codon:yes gene_type:complete
LCTQNIKSFDASANLLVYPAGKSKFLVHRGGRRLKQLQALIEEGVLPADMAVPCKFETEEQAIRAISS